MKKLPLKYKDSIIGYLDYIEVDSDNNINEAHFYLFDSNYYDEVIYNIDKGTFASLNKNPDIINITNNKLYDFELKEDLLILKKLKQ